MFLWGETDMVWTQGVIELYRWRRQRKQLAAQAAVLVTEAEAYLRAHGEQRQPPPSPPRPTEPPRLG